MMYAPHITRSPSKAFPETEAPTMRPTTEIKDMVRRRQIIVRNTPNNNTRTTGALQKQEARQSSTCKFQSLLAHTQYNGTRL